MLIDCYACHIKNADRERLTCIIHFLRHFGPEFKSLLISKCIRLQHFFLLIYHLYQLLWIHHTFILLEMILIQNYYNIYAPFP